MLVLNASTFGTTHWTLITALGTTTPPSASPPSGCDFDAAAVSASPLLVWRAMPRDRRLPLWGVLCRCLTALQTTRRRASGSAHVLSHRLYPLQAMRLHILLSGWSAPPRFCKAGEGNELLCSRRCRWSASCARATAATSATCKAPGCGNLGILAARLREQARCGPHNTAVATDRDSTAAFIARPPHPVCYFQCTRAMPRGRRLPLRGVLCRCLTALQTTRRRASGSAHVLSHRLL